MPASLASSPQGEPIAALFHEFQSPTSDVAETPPTPLSPSAPTGPTLADDTAPTHIDPSTLPPADDSLHTPLAELGSMDVPALVVSPTNHGIFGTPGL